MEKRGVPSMVFCTTVFEKMATLERGALGMPGLQLLVMEHPLLGREQGKLEIVVDKFMPILEARFGGQPS